MMEEPHKVTLRRAINVLTKEYNTAKKNPWVDKPLSNALYRTWKFFNIIEENRNENKS